MASTLLEFPSKAICPSLAPDGLTEPVQQLTRPALPDLDQQSSFLGSLTAITTDNIKIYRIIKDYLENSNDFEYLEEMEEFVDIPRFKEESIQRAD